MNVTVEGKQLDVGEALRTHITERLEAITGKYFEQGIEANVVVAKDRHLFKADVSIHASRNLRLQAQADADEVYPAFERAADKIAKRLRRYKRRLTDHHRKAASAAAVDASYRVLQAEADEPETAGDAAEPDAPLVVAEMATLVEELTVSEAVMRMDLGDLPALMFRNRAHGELNMLYRRGDGNIGWVDPSGQSGGA